MKFAVVILMCLAAPLLAGPYDWEEAPIRYSAAPVNDAVARLSRDIQKGKAKLAFAEDHGYLPALLDALGIPRSSQALVFSKTSFQRDQISPRTPRALYFNDDVYVGWVQGGGVIEITSIDKDLGPVFYTLSQAPTRPTFLRQTHDCLQCHDSGQTQNVPGLVVRSVYPDKSGQPILTAGTFLTDHASPLKERWGGWYVTGTHGGQRHMGNITTTESAADNLDWEKGANVTDLSKLFDTTPYLTPHSDIVALMVLEHQTKGQNLITKANYLTRLALRDEQVMNEALGREKDHRSDSTTSRIKSACEPLVKHLLFCEEAPLTAPVAGTSTFAADFAARGRRDGRGRSLRELDLKTRLFKHPLSFLIHSEQFAALPAPAKAYVEKRVTEVLTGDDTSEAFAHLPPRLRMDLLTIWRETAGK